MSGAPRRRSPATRSQDLMTRWPLQDMLGADLVAAAARRIEAPRPGGRRADEVDATLWLSVDSFALIQALAFLAGRLADEHGVQPVRLRLQPAGARAHLDLVWAGQAMSTETVMSWQTEPMRSGDGRVAADACATSPSATAASSGSSASASGTRPFFRFLLPLGRRASAEAAPSAGRDSRPEYYDFDLFRRRRRRARSTTARSPSSTYTVFDTETTGLDPAGGDEIIQIGARAHRQRQAAAQRVLRPAGRSAAAASPRRRSRSTASGRRLVRGQPTIAEVLPAFHAFARDTVLVAHNVAFDMRFLQLKEAASGVRFDQPVLDTLLLSSVAAPERGVARASRRSPSGWAWPSPAATRRSATRW